MSENIRHDETVDCRGLSRPIPILKAKKAISKMKSGQILEVLSTDPGTKDDLPSFADRLGHEYIGEKDDRGFTRYYIKAK